GPEVTLSDGEHDIWLHRVRLCSRELFLSLKLPSGRLKRAGGARVQFREGEETWRDDPDDPPSVEQPSADEVRLRVRHPRPGYRYGIAYSLASERQHLEAAHRILLKQVVVDCRNSPPTAGSLSQALTAAIGPALAKVLPNQIPEIWIAHLWHADWQVLVPVFGNFPARSWGSKFRYG